MKVFDQNLTINNQVTSLFWIYILGIQILMLGGNKMSKVIFIFFFPIDQNCWPEDIQVIPQPKSNHQYMLEWSLFWFHISMYRYKNTLWLLIEYTRKPWFVFKNLHIVLYIHLHLSAFIYTTHVQIHTSLHTLSKFLISHHQHTTLMRDVFSQKYYLFQLKYQEVWMLGLI